LSQARQKKITENCKPNRTEPNQNVGFSGFRFWLGFLAAGSSVFGSMLGSTINYNQNTEATE
jgi:hypothetical protein